MEEQSWSTDARQEFADVDVHPGRDRFSGFSAAHRRPLEAGVQVHEVRIAGNVGVQQRPARTVAPVFVRVVLCELRNVEVVPDLVARRAGQTCIRFEENERADTVRKGRGDDQRHRGRRVYANQGHALGSNLIQDTNHVEHPLVEVGRTARQPV
jgi:hypothetical protein